MALRFGQKLAKRVFVIGAVFVAPITSVPATAADFSDDTSYSHPYGMVAGQENQPVNAALRDGNGNLTIVNGQFTSSAMSQQSGLGTMSSGVGTAQATAIGNALNVVTVGSGNTVVVNSVQDNHGNQTATVSTNGAGKP